MYFICGFLESLRSFSSKNVMMSETLGSSLPMPPELMELYMLYQQELQTRQTEKEANYLSELNTMLRVVCHLDLKR